MKRINHIEITDKGRSGSFHNAIGVVLKGNNVPILTPLTLPLPSAFLLA